MYQELTQFKSWLKCQYPDSSASVHYSSDLALFFSFINKPPSSITPPDVDRFVTHSRQKRHSPSTINRRLSALRTFYYFLSITCDSPPACPILRRHRLRKSHPLPRDVSDSDIETLFAQIPHPRDKAIFLLMLDCGLRVSEVHHLSLDDIHFESPPHLIVHGKGGQQRIVYLSPPAQEALQRWLTSRPVRNDRAVFISEHGKRLSVSGIQYRLKHYCEKGGIQLTCHQLRHSFGRRMAEAHLPLTSLQSLLGHRNVRTTQIYIRLSDVYLQAEYDCAISDVATSRPVNSKVQCTKRLHSPKSKRINWKGYLDNLPACLADPIHTYCSRYSQAKDPIQHARNLLSQLSQFFRWMLAHIPHPCLIDVTPKLWFAYVETRLKSGIKPTSINTNLRALQSFLKCARDSGNPICERILEVRPLKTARPLPRDLTSTQLNHILEQANPHDYAWILLMSRSGLRTCEIRDLQWRDIDLQCRTIRIEGSKSLRSRVVFLSPPTLDAFIGLPKNSEYVFTYHNQPLSNRYCQSRLKTIGRKCGIHATPHQLRHTCATMLLNAGMSVFGVQVILGHKYVDTTLRYTRTYDITVARDYQQAMDGDTREHKRQVTALVNTGV